MTIISASHKFVFVHIHKNGGTSVETILEPYMMWNDLVLGSTELGALLNPFYSSRYGLTKHSKLARIEEVCKDYVDWKNFHCFALVRHPLTRVCSLYNWVAQVVRDCQKQSGFEMADIKLNCETLATKFPQLTWKPVQSFLSSSCFSDFIRSEQLWYAPAMHTQISFLQATHQQAVPFKLEELEKLNDHLSELLGTRIIIPHMNTTREQLIVPANVTPSDRSIIETNFANDYNSFGYS